MPLLTLCAAIALTGLGYLILRIGTDQVFLKDFDHLLRGFRLASRWTIVGTAMLTLGLAIFLISLSEFLRP